MTDVFISYARTDAPFVRRLHQALADVQRDTWVDWEDIPPTAEWMREIKAAIEGADAFVFVISPASVRSETCRIEIAHAAEHGKRLIPVVREDVAYPDVPQALGALQWLFFRDADDFSASFAALIRALDTDLEWVRTHTRLLVRAIEWEGKSREASLLMRGQELTQAETWLAKAPKTDPRPTPLQAEFIIASRRSATSRQRTLVGGLGAGIAITLSLAVVAWAMRQDAVKQRDESERQRQRAIAHQLAAQSEAARGQDARLIDRALLLAVESARRSPDAEAARALRGSLALLPRLLADLPAGGAVYAVAFSADGRFVAAGGDDSVRVWTSADGREVARLPADEGVRRLQFLGGAGMLAIAGAAAHVRVVDVTAQREVLRLPHGDRVYALAATADGRYLATGSDDAAVRVWDVPSGRMLWQALHRGPVRTVAFSRDGSAVASGGYDNVARAWNWRNGRLLVAGRHDEASASMPLRAGSRDGGVHAVSFSADGRYLASGGQDRTARIWDVEDGRERYRAVHADAVYAVAFSETLEDLATGSMDGAARLWNLREGGERFRFIHGGPVEHVQFGPDGRLLSTGGDGAARVWDPGTGREVVRMPHTDYVAAAAFDVAGRRIVTGSWDGSVRVWDSTAGEEAQRLVHGAPLRGLRFRPDGRVLLTWVSGERNERAFLWPLEPGSRAIPLAHPDAVDDARFSPDGTLVATACWDGIVRLWDSTTGALVRQLVHAGRVNRLAWSPDGQHIATSGIEEGLARVWKVGDGREVVRFSQPGTIEPRMKRMFPNGSVRDVAFNRDGSLLATAGADGAARIWNLARKEQVLAVQHPSYVSLVAFSPDGAFIATDSDKEAHVWELARGERVASVKHDESLTQLVFSPDQRYLLTAALDRTARVWALPGGRPVATLLHESSVFSVEMSPDRSLVVTASQDNTARIWSTESWREVSRLTHGDTVYAALFSPDQRYVATASDDGMARVAYVRVADLVEQACRRVGRNLTQVEWLQHLGPEDYRPTCGTGTGR